MVSVDVAHHHFGADAGIGVNQMRNKLGRVARPAHQLEPIQHRRLVGLRIAAVFAVRPKPFAGHNVLQPVAVHVRQRDGVQLGEDNAVFVGRGVRIQNQMLLELDLPLLVLLRQLLVPGQPEAVRAQGGDDVGQAVAVDIVGEHLRRTVGRRRLLDGGERIRMKFPCRVSGQGGRLLVPAILDQDVVATVAVDIAKAQTMRELLILLFHGRNPVKNPLLRRMRPIRRRGVADVVAHEADQLRLAVAQKVAEAGRFVIRGINHSMPRPEAFLVLGILVPIRLGAGETDNDNIRPAVAVDVEGESEEIFRVAIPDAQRALEAVNGGFFPGGVGRFEGMLGRPVWVAYFEIRAFVPERPGNDVRVAVVVEIGEIGPLAPELIRDLDFAERGNILLGRGQAGPNCKRREGDKKTSHNSFISGTWERRRQSLNDRHMAEPEESCLTPVKDYGLNFEL